MLIIDCPFCGPRDEVEFVYGGPARERRPDNSAHSSESTWRDYLLVPPNPMGPVTERWWHAKGCAQWITLSRSTMTHEISPLKDAESRQTTLLEPEPRADKS